MKKKIIFLKLIFNKLKLYPNSIRAVNNQSCEERWSSIKIKDRNIDS